MIWTWNRNGYTEALDWPYLLDLEEIIREWVTT